MSIDFKRRILLKGGIASSALGVAVGAGLLTPGQILAAWPKAAFQAKEVDTSLNELLGTSNVEESDQIKIKAPDIAENGAVVPVSVSTTLPAESIAVLALNNPVPLIANYTMSDSSEGFIACRIKMGKSGDVVAVVKSGGKLYRTAKEVKVTIGGCGG